MHAKDAAVLRSDANARPRCAGNSGRARVAGGLLLKARMADYDAIVIGSDAGGLTAAFAMARQGARVALFEQHERLGGSPFSPGVPSQCGASTVGPGIRGVTISGRFAAAAVLGVASDGLRDALSGQTLRTCAAEDPSTFPAALDARSAA